MEDVLGGRTRPERFSDFLANWHAILLRRVDQAVTALTAVDGVSGLVLAGSIGRGEPWPLSDIDLLPIYDDRLVESCQGEIERLRVALLVDWIDEGWWTGLDIGRLYFTHAELDRMLTPEGPDVRTILQDDRWYYSLDKGYRGRGIFDPEGLASSLVIWITEHRFSEPVVEFRLARTRREVDEARHRCISSVQNSDPMGVTSAIRSAAKWVMTWQLELWGERDTSQGRIGTRFEHLACEHGRPDLVDALRYLNDLDDESVKRRMAKAPDWVWERHDRSFRARRFIGEDVTRMEDARDSLHVSTLYEMRRISTPPFPAWLAIPADIGSLQNSAEELSVFIDRCMTEGSDRED